MVVKNRRSRVVNRPWWQYVMKKVGTMGKITPDTLIGDNNTQIFIVFIINNKNAINIIKCSWLAVVANTRFVKIFSPPCYVSHGEFSRICAWLSNYLFFILIYVCYWRFFPSSEINVFNYSIGTILPCSTLGYLPDEKVEIIGQKAARHCNGGNWRDTISTIKYTSLFQNFTNFGWNIL